MHPIELIRSFQGQATQETYAKTLGISQSHLSAILNGTRKPTYAVLVALARAYPKAKREVAKLFFDPHYFNQYEQSTDEMGQEQAA